jgi:hypothetical protein
MCQDSEGRWRSWLGQVDGSSTQHVHSGSANRRRLDDPVVVITEAERILWALHYARAALNTIIASFDVDLSAVTIHV